MTANRFETLKRLVNDNSVSWHETVARAYDAGLAKAAEVIEAAQRGAAAAHEAQYQADQQLAEIHNRFCGENGEPCQVCRLKAEREERSREA